MYQEYPTEGTAGVIVTVKGDGRNTLMSMIGGYHRDFETTTTPY